MSLSSVVAGCSSLPKPIAIDGYCQRYNPVIQEKGDGAAVAGIKKEGPKRRTYANELTYRQQCQAPGPTS